MSFDPKKWILIFTEDDAHEMANSVAEQNGEEEFKLSEGDLEYIKERLEEAIPSVNDRLYDILEELLNERKEEAE